MEAVWENAFALTLVVEVPIVVACVPRGMRSRASLVALATQALTHPLAWTVFQHGVMGWWGVECAVVAVEACAYALATRRVTAAVLVSLFANAASAAMGLVVLGA